jgi:hypothetical protein
MIKNDPPDNKNFVYNIDKLPFGFSSPTTVMTRELVNRHNSYTRNLFKLFRNNCNLQHDMTFTKVPITAGEFCMIIIKQQQKH